MPEEKKEKPISFIMMAALLSFAIVIDILQAAMDLASEPLFIILFAAAGGATGAVAAAILSFGILTIVGGAAGIAAGTAFGAFFGIVFGIVFGLFLDVVAVCVLGLWFNLLSTDEQPIHFGGKLAIGSIIEVVPVLNMLPGWTLATAWTIFEANGNSIAGLASTALSFIPAGRAASIGLKAAGAAKVAEGATTAAAAPASMATKAGMRAPSSMATRAGEMKIPAAPRRAQIDGLRQRSSNDNEKRRTLPQADNDNEPRNLRLAA